MVAMMPLPNKTPGNERVAVRFARSRYVYNYRGRCVLLGAGNLDAKLSFKDRACRVQEDSQYTEHDLLNTIEIHVES